LASNHGRSLLSKNQNGGQVQNGGQGNFLSLISRVVLSFFQSVFGFEFVILLASNHGRSLLSKKSNGGQVQNGGQGNF
jgi:hypothetical protein